jgi:BlaI family transcriptional regulator, penicillinase repressor
MVLYEHGEASVRDVHQAINKKKKTAYSSVATIMRIMANKGWVNLTDVKRPQKFAPAITKENLGKSLMEDMASRIFGGSVVSMVRHALTGKKRSAGEITELRKLLDEID